MRSQHFGWCEAMLSVSHTCWSNWTCLNLTPLIFSSRLFLLAWQVEDSTWSRPYTKMQELSIFPWMELPISVYLYLHTQHQRGYIKGATVHINACCLYSDWPARVLYCERKRLAEEWAIIQCMVWRPMTRHHHLIYKASTLDSQLRLQYAVVY